MDLKDAWRQGDGQANGNMRKPRFCHRGHEFPNLSQHLAPQRKARSQVRGSAALHRNAQEMSGQPQALESSTGRTA